MTFRQLEYVIEVANQGSISVAARKLMISQPSLSQSIKSIENEFNITLFDRSSVPLIPTKSGAIFLNKAKTILGTLDDLKNELAMTETTHQELRIGVSDSGAIISRHIFKSFQTIYPGTKLLLVERDQFTLERMLEAGKLDMIFTMIPNENPNLRVIPLLDDKLLIALPKRHPFSVQCEKENPFMLGSNGNQLFFPSIDLNSCTDIRDVRFVLSGRDRLKIAQLAVLRSAFEPEIGFETDTLASAIAISAHEPHGTVVPKLFSMLYDGPELPYFFECTGKLPTWGFTLSLQKKFKLSDAALKYIELFVGYIEDLMDLTDELTTDKLLKYLRKKSKQSRSR